MSKGWTAYAEKDIIALLILNPRIPSNIKFEISRLIAYYLIEMYKQDLMKVSYVDVIHNSEIICTSNEETYNVVMTGLTHMLQITLAKEKVRTRTTLVLSKTLLNGGVAYSEIEVCLSPFDWAPILLYNLVHKFKLKGAKPNAIKAAQETDRIINSIVANNELNRVPVDPIVLAYFARVAADWFMKSVNASIYESDANTPKARSSLASYTYVSYSENYCVMCVTYNNYMIRCYVPFADSYYAYKLQVNKVNKDNTVKLLAEVDYTDNSVAEAIYSLINELGEIKKSTYTLNFFEEGSTTAIDQIEYKLPDPYESLVAQLIRSDMYPECDIYVTGKTIPRAIIISREARREYRNNAEQR